MSSSAIMMQIGKACLASVPAIHYRSVFAQHVHRVCHSRKTMPDAIAVELEPEALAAILALLKNHGDLSSQYLKLPCMLGLARTDWQTAPSYFSRQNGSFTINPRSKIRNFCVSSSGNFKKQNRRINSNSPFNCVSRS